jgi:DNA-binding SARP family transcriptional activator
VRFKLLGSFEVQDQRGGDVTPAARRQRQVLAMLLLEANRRVRIDRLMDELWEDRPPRSARTTLQTYVYQLRKMIAAECASGRTDEVRLVTGASGYELRLAQPEAVDVNRFTALVEQARQGHQNGLFEDAAGRLRTALDLWSGPALEDIDAGPVLKVDALRLDEARRAALELRIDIDMQLGRHHELVSELISLVRADNANEAFVARLMLALVRCGRRAEALSVYRQARAVLVSEFGLEPSDEVCRLHAAILRGEPTPALWPAQPEIRVLAGPPAELPPGVAGFVGYGDELAQARAVLGAGEAAGRAVTRRLQVLGAPGSGKTAFALHLAHALRSQFPDGQLFQHPHTDGNPSNEVAAVLGRLLRSCGMPAERLGSRVDDLISAFRTWTAERRVLVVLDDARSAAVVQAVQPAGDGCAVLVTARVPLPGLAGFSTVRLAPLTHEESLDLLRNVLGSDRVAAELSAARRLVRLCDHLPLALHSVAGRLSGRPHWPIVRVVDRLSAAEDRLVELGVDGGELLSSVEATCQSMGPVVRDAFFALVRRGVREFDPETFAGGSQLSSATGGAVLEQLVDAQLVTECVPHRGAVPRYRVSPLTAMAARRLAAA